MSQDREEVERWGIEIEMNVSVYRDTHDYIEIFQTCIDFHVFSSNFIDFLFTNWLQMNGLMDRPADKVFYIDARMRLK